MAIKERLLKQLQILRDGLNAMPPFHSRDLNAMRSALVQARDLCFQGLSAKSFAEYKDTYDGLLLAIDQLAADAPDQGEIVSLCSELLQYTMTQTQKETNFKKEIFFLPYKASMWDSLESVWKAADEDKEHCIAYVMPIPYADLTPEHTVAEWHCEREIFPKNVPTLDWQTVDLEEMHPDVIFIHNPYDEYNRVTSVESRYYSSNLKSCTDKLVYIPYFVLEEMSPGDEAAEDNISGFILTPAVLNAHQVIVQSEDMRQVYINVLIRNTDQKDRAYWEKRILGLGSPKIEKVLTSKKEDFELPEAWAKIVQGKKIILYNTSLNAMLQNSDKVCDKLRYVFNIFKNRDDVALWWRPHPLMKATIHSMRPEIETEYEAIEREYIQESFGVYDDTGNLQRAIVYSDAYYGDGSSVVQLYQKTGKPIMIQDVGHSNKLAAMDVACVEQCEYMVDLFQNLFTYEFQNNQVVYRGKITQEAGMYIRVHLSNDNQLFFVPFSYGTIRGYDIQGDNFYDVLRPAKELGIQQMPSRHVFSYGNSVYFFGCGERGSILRLDMTTKKYTIDDTWMKRFEERYGHKTTAYYPYDGIQIDNTVWFTLKANNMVMEYDMLNEESHFHIINSSFNHFISICHVGEDFWLTGDAPVIVQWNPKSNIVKEYDSFPQGFCKRTFSYIPWNDWDFYFNQSVLRGDYIYFSPQRANMLIAIHTKTGKIVKIKELREDVYCFPMVKRKNGKILIQEKNTNWKCVEEYEIDDDNNISKTQSPNHIIFSSKLTDNHNVMSEGMQGMFPAFVQWIKIHSTSSGLNSRGMKLISREEINKILYG